ncbi:bifunctional aspartate kinase/homoserine dehydrogenase II [Thalassotalea sp. PLHSN55]|uniref:bifunctional aspartate kinase/homoserine dehydrogenase II n=1 Tax=Thalassotalea sp. PLHSN55 TaxID=3435888 RepID=UPI003F85E442
MQTNVATQQSIEPNQLAKHAISVHKFGGSSLATTQCIERVVSIIQKNCQLNDVVVVSASGDTTDEIFALYQLALEQDENFPQALSALERNQSQLIESLLSDNNSQQLIQLLKQDIAQIVQWSASNLPAHHSDILAFGEVWSARLLSATLNERVCPSYHLDARDFLVINNSHDCQLEQNISAAQFRALQQHNKLVVVTGYITKDSAGNSCTLGRNGSDYSATIMASLANAERVTLWTDVDGIYSADPRVVPNARKLNRLPNGVAKELGRLGNPVLHAKTLQPLIDSTNDRVIHLHVASSFAPEISGTEIGKFGQIAKQELSITYQNDLLLAKSESFKGEQGKASNAEFNYLCADYGQGFVVISQTQQKAVSQWLASHNTEVSFTPVSIVGVVGHKVSQHGSIKARFKRALKTAQYKHLLPSDSKHALIAVLPQPCTVELLNIIHRKMTKDARHIGLVVAGLGNIGQRFLEMLPKQMTKIDALESVHLVGLVSSKKALLQTDGIDVNHAIELFEQEASTYDEASLLSSLANHPYDELIVVDITPSEQFSLLYAQFFQQGIHVIGANKWAASSSTEHYQQLKQLAAKHESLWLGNTTVGAGLPINFAIDDLLNSGDEIQQISGIFSGTLSWLFESYDGSEAFSSLMLNALSQGITEPDPREDLSGRDVQRKLLILARAAGFNLSLEDIDCVNLVPEALQNISKEEFLGRANELDDFFAEQLSQANANGQVIRYVARFTVTANRSFKAQVSLEKLSKDHAFANLTPCDNIFEITSNWYQDNPLIIRGPGAGRDVTAGGIHSDLVAICQQLASKQQQVTIKGLN